LRCLLQTNQEYIDDEHGINYDSLDSIGTKSIDSTDYETNVDFTDSNNDILRRGVPNEDSGVDGNAGSQLLKETETETETDRPKAKSQPWDSAVKFLRGARRLDPDGLLFKLSHRMYFERASLKHEESPLALATLALVFEFVHCDEAKADAAMDQAVSLAEAQREEVAQSNAGATGGDWGDETKAQVDKANDDGAGLPPSSNTRGRSDHQMALPLSAQATRTMFLCSILEGHRKHRANSARKVQRCWRQARNMGRSLLLLAVTSTCAKLRSVVVSTYYI